VRLKLCGSHQLLVSADAVNLLVHNANTIRLNTEALINASKAVHLEVNTQKTNAMVAAIQFRTFCLLVCFQKMEKLQYAKL
jgi:hypothetical protein